MEKIIYKYPLEITDVQSVKLPIGAEVLTIQTQNDIPCLWALVDPKETKNFNLTLEIFGTGFSFSYDMGISRKYISTFQIKGGRLVFHVFEYTGV